MSKARKYIKNKETGVVEKVSVKTFSALLLKGTHKASSGVEKVRVDSAYRRMRKQLTGSEEVSA